MQSEHMSVWGLISEASVVVQLVMVILVLASIASWYIIIQRGVSLRRNERLVRGFLQRFRSGAELTQLYREGGDQALPREAALQHIFHAGFQEFSQLQRQPGIAPDAVIDGVERSLYVAISEQEERLEGGLQFLATVGSVSPYIGLFGTVWGIMNSFLGLSMVQQATLSTVAPGIAEALIATAIGLFAAIPAVMAYNRFSARGQTLSARYYSFANELQARLHRRLHAGSPSVAAAA
ncbi:protein TolQ [Stutzerimonas zhaodongensis]|uniref:Tol-Pal system protein TolQ n=1 Tax=Stutzerimonas zhaodongensis TaxID=1176257 RepID=A0A3M2HQM6_9GAMM|nr:protein TolQ [Stutzerimonas zhaodongensis]MCQ2028467.1 protein TolQ [Stutzerimonas zhaodongensis]MCQ4317427.1 protein TolQ [Stutzerimonas zhaodongensis]RMH89900.1 protein TolQ [Stutzerimonas zhaodongensis]